MRSVCLAPVLLLTLAGCDLMHVPTDISAPGIADTDGALRESIARVNQAMNEMADKGASGSVKNLGHYAAIWIAGWPNCPSSTAALT